MSRFALLGKVAQGLGKLGAKSPVARQLGQSLSDPTTLAARYGLDGAFSLMAGTVWAPENATLGERVALMGEDLAYGVGASLLGQTAGGMRGARKYRKMSDGGKKPVTITEKVKGPDGKMVDTTRPITEAEMIDRNTRVLKGHIQLAQARFPLGTNGGQLDTLARMHLWQAGVDYGHGTGHGVGSYLSVHEGPQRISKSGGAFAGTDTPLAAGMLLSNEPGYYKPGEFGIRIENLVLTVEVDIDNAEGAWLGFETLTFVPLDRRLVDKGLLTQSEVEWWNAYHAQVRAILAPQLEGGDLEWLEAECAAL